MSGEVKSQRLSACAVAIALQCMNCLRDCPMLKSQQREGVDAPERAEDIPQRSIEELRPQVRVVAEGARELSSGCFQFQTVQSTYLPQERQR